MTAPQYRHWFQLLLVTALSFFWGGLIALQMMFQVVTKGPRRVFCGRTWDKRPKVLDNPELGTHHYARLESVRLHYVAKGKEGKPLLLFLHGFPELWYSWRFQLKEFSDNYRAVAVDMRGYGESTRPQGISEYTFDKLTGDIKQFIEYLGYSKCYLVGHDFGGLVAWTFATKYPAMVDKLVICNVPNPYAFEKYVQSKLSQFLKSWYIFLFQLPVLPEILIGVDNLAMFRTNFQKQNVSEEDLEAFLYTFRNYADRTGPVNYYRAALRYKTESLPSDKVKAATMIIWGTRDAVLERKMAYLSKAYVENTCYVIEIEGATHWVQQDEPELLNKYIRDFLTNNREMLERK